MQCCIGYQREGEVIICICIIILHLLNLHVSACICSFLDPVAFYQYLWSHQCRVSSPFSAQCIPDPINVKCRSCKLQLPIHMYECVTLLNSRAILLEVELKQKHQKRGMLKVSCPPPSIAVLWANITLRRVHATWLHCWHCAIGGLVG